MNTNNLEASEPIMPANESPLATGMNNLRVESADAAREWLSLEHLALGSERVGGMVVRSAPMRKVLKAISRFSPHKATVLIQGETARAENWSHEPCIRRARRPARLLPSIARISSNHWMTPSSGVIAMYLAF